MKAVTAAGAAVLAALAIAASASADPVNAKNAAILTGTCDGTPVQVVTNGNGEWTPGIIQGSNAVLIPEAFDMTFTSTFDGSTEVETDTSSKALHGNVVQCTFAVEDNTFTFPGGLFSISGTVWARVA
jgi:opacity protein-like surface antigen